MSRWWWKLKPPLYQEETCRNRLTGGNFLLFLLALGDKRGERNRTGRQIEGFNLWFGYVISVQLNRHKSTHCRWMGAEGSDHQLPYTRLINYNSLNVANWNRSVISFCQGFIRVQLMNKSIEAVHFRLSTLDFFHSLTLLFVSDLHVAWGVCTQSPISSASIFYTQQIPGSKFNNTFWRKASAQILTLQSLPESKDIHSISLNMPFKLCVQCFSLQWCCPGLCYLAQCLCKL